MNNNYLKIFEISDHLSIFCEYKKTRNGFKHTATLKKNGYETADTVKICYLNRTWESFEYESVIEKLLDRIDFLTDTEKKAFLLKASGQAQAETDKAFGSIAMIAKMGDIIGQNQKEKNDWKAQMLKAGLENKGLTMPEDWDTLSEDEKERRLNGVITTLTQ